jgi:hypothetical protein
MLGTSLYEIIHSVASSSWFDKVRASKKPLRIVLCSGVWLVGGQLLFSGLITHAQQKQTVSRAQSASTQGYLALVLRVHANDRCLHVLKATEVSGKLVLREGPSSKAIYEITKDDRNLVVGFLPEDPLTARGFASSSDPVENTTQSESATILLNAPFADLKAARDGRLGIRFYTLKSGIRVPSINPEELKALETEGKVTLQFELSQDELASQIKRLSQK